MIHTAVGQHTVGARVNGELVPLRHELQNGDTVEIITSPQAQPHEDWLQIVEHAGRAQQGAPLAAAAAPHGQRGAGPRDARARAASACGDEARREVPLEEVARGVRLRATLETLLRARGRGAGLADAR